MITRTLRLATLPGCVTLLCALHVQAPPAFLPEPTTDLVKAVVEPPKPEPLREVSRLLAVDDRIAKRVNQLRPSVKQRLQKALDKLPENVTILVTSAHRTREEQAALVPTFGIKARPGTSTHEDGRAVDVNVFVDGERVPPRRQNKIIGEAMAAAGFRYLGPRDPVHYSVPKERLDPKADDVTLPVMTMAEAEEIRAEHQAAAESVPTPAAGIEVPPIAALLAPGLAQ